ncbi:hypothetical protein ACIRRA_35540 [Nocardia sp. NPDC101769]|uniref:hypothetical protein n=1 Tax=Nocardia sp. NPDC101769 TaxID=3364333 RepID=UPI00381A659C
MSADIGKLPSTTGPDRAAQPALRWVAGGAVFALALAVWGSTHVHTGPVVREAALFVHLAALVVGLGAVLVADYLGLLWLAGRVALAEVVAGTRRLHLPIWIGLCGLVISGMFLSPDLAAAATRVKLTLVLVLVCNGVQALALGRRMAAASSGAAGGLVWRGAVTAVVSQGCWWGAMWIGFITAEHS